MSYRRFKLANAGQAASASGRTVASVATVAAPEPAARGLSSPNVASVATVAAPPDRRKDPVDVSLRSDTPATLATFATVLSGEVGARIILEAYGRILAASGNSPGNHIQVVERFLVDHWGSARRLGWSDVELFGCHAQSAFALVRYDCMGAVTLAVLTGSPITRVDDSEIRYENDLATRRNRLFSQAAPVWKAFPPSHT